MDHDDFNLNRKIVLVLYIEKKNFFLLFIIWIYWTFLTRKNKSRKLSENIPRMSAEERGKAIGMLQTECSIK
jgi:hypothetical protein